MGWVLKVLELPPQEDAIAKAWVEAVPFQEFMKWVEHSLRVMNLGEDGPLRTRVLGKVLEFAGQSLQSIADETGGDEPNGWDGSHPRPAAGSG